MNEASIYVSTNSIILFRLSLHPSVDSSLEFVSFHLGFMLRRDFSPSQQPGKNIGINTYPISDIDGR